MTKQIISAVFISLLASIAQADVCDYRPSKLVTAGGVGATVTASAAIAAAGASMKAAGFYTLAHATSGALMLGSTAGGASAAGTVGIMGGTAGAVGTVSAVLMSPVVLTGAVITAGGIAAFEGGCYAAARKKA